MRVIVAPDSFGDTLTAREAADAIADGWIAGAPGDEQVVVPLSDGGPGFLDALAAALGAERRVARVRDPRGRVVDAEILLDGSGSAYVEAAQACGLHLVPAAERDALAASSFGVGQLLLHAADAGAREIVVGLGGSASTDAGAGLLQAIGLDLLDGAGRPLPPGGAALVALERMAGTPALRGVTLVAAGDVDNPLTGEHGAATVFGPQKGVGADDVGRLDAGLARWAEVAERDLPTAPPGLAAMPGGGAAGGLGAALLALGGRRASGFGVVADVVGLADSIAGADLVVTGEGSFDWQSLRGKVPSGVSALATAAGLPCLVLAGQVTVARREAAAAGVAATYAMADHAGSVAAARADPAAVLRALAERVAREWSR